MFAGTHKFAKRLFLPTECASDGFRLRRVNLRFGANQHFASDPRSGHGKRRSHRFGGHHARDWHARARESDIVVCVDF
jgi:hypothetical protein